MASTRSRRALPRLLERLRAWGLGEQAFKAALAAGIAWVLSGFVPAGPPASYLAPLTAMLSVQLTVEESVTGAIHRTGGARSSASSSRSLPAV